MSNNSGFIRRHIGVHKSDLDEMLSKIGCSSMGELIEQTVPENIYDGKALEIGEALTEFEYLNFVKAKAEKNKVYKTYIGCGYYGTITPSVIQRNILENPGWYTQYTPYQAEISQGRLEALLNFQTVISDLTGLPIANASLLDEGTAAAEAMAMFYQVVGRNKNKKDAHKFFVDEHVFKQTKDVLESRSIPLGVELVYGRFEDADIDNSFFGALVQYPDSNGEIKDFSDFAEKIHTVDARLVVAADILSLVLLDSPASKGADCAVGNTQRLGVPMGYGGPHAAYFSCTEEFKRFAPGRIIGVSVDAENSRAFRMALQTREQHIKRERATSNICTAQALLAIMAGMYAVWHGPEGLKDIARSIHTKTTAIAQTLSANGVEVLTKTYFDTIRFKANTQELEQRCLAKEINLFYDHNRGVAGFSMDETKSWEDGSELVNLIIGKKVNISEGNSALEERTDKILTHPVFNSRHSETVLMRYIKRLENKDLSLMHSMIPLGSCTMKLNAATQLMPVSWPEFSQIHPFVPKDQAEGYLEIIKELESYLAKITGFSSTSLQPNSGAQGEYTGLMVIRAYHEANNSNRNVMLIPSSAHGTNPASAVMAGMKVVVVKIEDDGRIDLIDLRAKCTQYAETLAGIMVTYPATTGIYEESIVEVCDVIHDYGGLVYMDGANMNAQVGLTSPGKIGADVCHLNLHKTFAIPHGGGGPGMGPICVNDKLKPYLPGHSLVATGGTDGISAVASAPYGSASILLISYAYIKLLGDEGLRKASEYAILNANYLADSLKNDYTILYRGANNRVAHEFIIDLRDFKRNFDIDAEDVAKRLMDYGFHAPTMSWPIPGTIMIEPTESEDKGELDRFVDAMKGIRQEIALVEEGKVSAEDSPLQNAPHTLNSIVSKWNRKYSREEAVYPAEWSRTGKFWPSVARVNNSFGDRNLVCTCPPIEAYMEEV